MALRKVDWDAHPYLGYQPAQFDPSKFSLPLGCCDWWGPRSWCCGAIMPCITCINGRCNPCLVQHVDITDPTIWKATLDLPTSCPESMRGVWWLCDNIAAETLVCFNDAKWTKLEDRPGEWHFQHDLPQTWSRDGNAFGGILGAVNAWRGTKCCNLSTPWVAISFIFNLEKGKAVGDVKEFAWRINEDEWQKAGFTGPYEQPGSEINFMYRWRRVIRADGSTTPAFQEMTDVVTSPYPYRNCLEPWCPMWPLLLTKEERLRDMAFSNRKQLVIWRPEFRKPVCSCWGLACTCPCMCPIAKDVDGAYAEWAKEVEAGPEQQLMSKP